MGLETSVIHTGDVYDVLPTLPESSVHMCMTSPPYFGLRDYGEEDQIGLEESLDEYIDKIVEVFREIRRVLRPDGSAWLNLGDTYSGGGGVAGKPSDHEDLHADDNYPDNPPARETRFGRKNKMLVPHRVAIALQDDGWVVRNDVTWVKPNPMPSSVKDRLNTTTEQIFHLTPDPDYWYDLDAIREPHATRGHHEKYHGDGIDRPKLEGSNNADGVENTGLHPAGKNPGDVFEVTTKPFPEAHFAVYPPELCEKPIKATCPPKVCAACGSPYNRKVEREERGDNSGRRDDPRVHGNSDGNLAQAPSDWQPPEVDLKGWEQSCDCDTDATEAGIALDPFAGAGTTLFKAKELGRRFVGVELNAEYADLARSRLEMDLDDPSVVRSDDAQSGLEAYSQE